jgi:RNA polymerase sigma-70 factor (ECF subfamily)
MQKGNDMTADLNEEDLLRRARAGDEAALGELFAHYRARLRKMVRLRLDRRVYGRIDPSDVLQEAYLDLARRFPEYAAGPPVPFYLWLRALTGQRLIDLHRGALPLASPESLAQHLLGRLTSPTQAAIRAEMQLRLQEAINALEPLDREVEVLRHFEELSNSETAEVLGIEKSTASKRYVRAIQKLKAVLDTIPGFFD